MPAMDSGGEDVKHELMILNIRKPKLSRLHLKVGGR